MTGRVGLAGDWHGNVSWAMSRIRLFAAQGISTIYPVGDFGLWPGATGEYFLKTLHRACVDRDLEMFIVLGNHEDYHRAAAMQLTSRDGFAWRATRASALRRAVTPGSMRTAPALRHWEEPDRSIAIPAGSVSTGGRRRNSPSSTAIGWSRTCAVSSGLAWT